MATTRSFWETPLFILVRLSPLLAPLWFLQLGNLPHEMTLLTVERGLTLLAILLLWNLTEGSLMLWNRESRAKSDKARGYGFVALMLGAVTLLVLPIYRARCSQSVFVLVLTLLALRGVARSGWEQGRPQVGTVAALMSHSLLAVVSFLSIQEPLPWQALVTSVAFGAAVTVCEIAWNRDAFVLIPAARWPLSTARVLLFLGPVALGTLALMGRLPQHYLVIWLSLIIAHRISSSTLEQGGIQTLSFRRTIGFYLLFVVILTACATYAARMSG